MTKVANALSDQSLRVSVKGHVRVTIHFTCPACPQQTEKTATAMVTRVMRITGVAILSYTGSLRRESKAPTISERTFCQKGSLLAVASGSDALGAKPLAGG